MEINKLDDQDLIQLYTDGNNKAFEVLLTRHKRIVYASIYKKIQNKELAEDIFHDTFIKVIDNLRLRKYNESGKFLPWVLRIANNLVIDYFRKNNRFRKADFYKNDDDEPFDIFSLLGNKEISIEDLLINEQIKEDLKTIINNLPDDQQKIIHLRFFIGLSFKEIAEDLDISINTALGRMRYALINLRKIIEENNIILHQY